MVVKQLNVNVEEEIIEALKLQAIKDKKMVKELVAEYLIKGLAEEGVEI